MFDVGDNSECEPKKPNNFWPAFACIVVFLTVLGISTAILMYEAVIYPFN